MSLEEWGKIADLAVSPIFNVVLAFFVWKLAGEVKDLKKAIFENGFVHKSDLESAWKLANEVHRRHDEDIHRLEAEDLRIRNEMMRLRAELE